MPPELRDTIPVFADDNGLLLAYKCGIDSRVYITEETVNILKISVKSNIYGVD